MAVTRKDVAALAGVSPALVSYVINDGPRPVSAAARQRILDAIEQLRYRPDGLARSLRIGSTRTIALMVPDASNQFFAELARAIEDEAFASGYAVQVCNSADDSARERAYLRGLADRRVDGLLFISAIEEQDFSELTNLDIPVIAMDRARNDSPVSTVRVDNTLAAYLGTTHLLQHGHVSPALIAGPDGSVTEERHSGWLSALDEHGMRPGPVIAAPFTLAGGRDAATQLFSTTSRPTAALVSSDAQAVGALHALDLLNLHVPADAALVSIDGTQLAQFTTPTLTVIAQPILEMAHVAVEKLLRLRRHPAPPEHIELGPALRAGRSCGCNVR